MVQALRRIHEALEPGGVLLDIHPQPTHNLIEVWQGGVIHQLGQIDQSEDHVEIEDARDELRDLVSQGLFVPEDEDSFELLEHHDSVASWEEKWAGEGYRLVPPPGMLEEANRLLASGGGELVIREQVRATRLRRPIG